MAGTTGTGTTGTTGTTPSTTPSTTTPPARKGFGGTFVTLGAVGLGLLLFAAWLAFRSDESSRIEDGKEYALAYSYLVDFDTGGRGRVFDFSDRNLPRTSIVVPLADERGPLTRTNSALPPSTARKVREKVTARVIEGVEYPGYEYVMWEYNFTHATNQTHIPTVTPKKD